MNLTLLCNIYQGHDFFQVSGHNFHSVMMESCFVFTAFYIPDHIPEWKQNIKVTKTFPSLRSPDRLLGPWLAYIAPGKCVVAIFISLIVLLHYCLWFSFFKCLSNCLFIHRRKENIPREVFSLFWDIWRQQEKRTESGIPHYSEFFGTGWAFLCPLSLAPIPIIQNSSSATGFLAHSQNALIDAWTVCARKQIWTHGHTFQAHNSSLS